MAGKVAFVYADKSFLRPESLFGHGFVVFYEESHPELNSPTLSFIADIPAFSTDYLVNGVFGGFYGVYRLEPYYKKLDEYYIKDARKLLFYELGSSYSYEEFMDIALSFSELKQKYYFFNNNCADGIYAFLLSLDPKIKNHTPYHWLLGPQDIAQALGKTSVKTYSLNSKIETVGKRPVLQQNYDSAKLQLEFKLFGNSNPKYENDYLEAQESHTPKYIKEEPPPFSENQLVFRSSATQTGFYFSPSFRSLDWSLLNDTPPWSSLELFSFEINYQKISKKIELSRFDFLRLQAMQIDHLNKASSGSAWRLHLYKENHLKSDFGLGYTLSFEKTKSLLQLYLLQRLQTRGYAEYGIELSGLRYHKNFLLKIQSQILFAKNQMRLEKSYQFKLSITPYWLVGIEQTQTQLTDALRSKSYKQFSLLLESYF